MKQCVITSMTKATVVSGIVYQLTLDLGSCDGMLSGLQGQAAYRTNLSCENAFKVRATLLWLSSEHHYDERCLSYPEIANSLLHYRKTIHRGLSVGFPGFEDRVGEAGSVDRVRVVLRFQADAVVLLVIDAAFAGEFSVEKVTGV